MGYNIVLLEPEIPNNTGNIGRLSIATGSKLHLIRPFGFEISDKRLKRAGLDYWQYVSLFIYDSIEDFYKKNKKKNMIYFSRYGNTSYLDVNFKDEQFLIFGKESIGLPQNIIDKNKDKTYNIPIYSKYVRSLNLANAVSVVVYEGLKALNT